MQYFIFFVDPEREKSKYFKMNWSTRRFIYLFILHMFLASYCRQRVFDILAVSFLVHIVVTALMGCRSFSIR